jgi:uncharacterized protein YqjF (DUF2071 family)
MFEALRNHPFAVDAFFESSLVVTYAVPKVELEALLPKCLELDTYNNEWAFIAVAMVQTKALRPKGFPKWMGNNFFLIGYRIFVTYTTSTGKRLRGLYILKSETNKKKMEWLGSIFTQYNYTTTDILQTLQNNIQEIKSVKSEFSVSFIAEDTDVSLPPNSPFTSWKEARRFAGPLPFTFSYNPLTAKVLIVQGVRQFWQPQPVNIVNASFGFIEDLHLHNVHLASAFIVKNIPYSWKKGTLDTWH